jgi:YidC/Oxa1 family membrane protein insertase
MPDQRNVFIAIVLSLAVLLVWSLVFPQRPAEKSRISAPGQTRTQAQGPNSASVTGAPAEAPLMDRAQALAASGRVVIEAPRIAGSLSLTGARIDDLKLMDYREHPLGREHPPEKNPNITLLSPPRSKDAYYAEFGWEAGAGTAVPGPDTVWNLEAGSRLTPNAPVTLRWDSPQGLTFRLSYAIDANYMVTVTQEVANRGAAPATLGPFGRIVRQTLPTGPTFMVQHEGFVGYLADDLRERTWKDVAKPAGASWTSTNGWLGLTDKYWMTALAPPQNEEFTARSGTEGLPAPAGTAALFELKARQIPVGGSARSVSHFFAGAKEVHVVDGYTKDLGIKKFDLAIDWGTFLWVITKPLFYLMDWLYNSPFFFHNFGIAILLVTVIVKLLFFPLANRSFVMMGKMKKLQPQMKELQERHKDDKAALQKEMMALYQKEKINPLAGCLPIFIQIPVFFSLYKVIFTTIEMRHAPFYGWVQDLSARDPTALINLFGLLPFHAPDPASFGIFGIIISVLTVGIWPLIMGLTMFLQTSLNPAPADPTQKIVFGLMPVIFTVMLASFPAGLVIYYTWNNLLSITQQYIIMKRMGTPLDLSNALGLKAIARFVRALRSRPPRPGEGETGA